MLKYWKLCYLFFLCTIVNGQEEPFSIHLQITATLGSPTQNIGARIIGRYTTDSQLEFTGGCGITYNFTGYGPSKSHIESNMILAGHYTWGDDYWRLDTPEHSYIKYLDNRTTTHTFGYTWERFFNTIGTSQNVGTFTFRLKELILLASNDVFANSNGRDRFRTGAFGIGYLDGPDLFSIKALIWTGETRCKEVEKYGSDSYPSRWGYRDITDCPYGRFSHGILSFGYHRYMEYGQMVGAEIGYDSEKTRNIIQNKVFHDLYFIPRFINKTKNKHLPMKTTTGESYLFLSDQEIRSTKFVWQVMGNGSLLY